MYLVYLESSSYMDSLDPELDDIRRAFLRNIMKGSNSQTLNIVPRDSTPITVPQIVFKFASIGGVEGILWEKQCEGECLLTLRRAYDKNYLDLDQRSFIERKS